jgi:hypothetical protein
MTQFEVYKYYIALKLHFTTDNYDVIKHKGRIKASRIAFTKRKDLFSIRKIADNYTNEEVVNFLVANFVSGDRWGGMFDSEAKVRYDDWRKRTESLQYNFEKELDTIVHDLELSNLNNEELFKISKNEHPYIIKAYLRKDISIETLVILEKILGFTDKFDNEINDTIFWPDMSRLIKKYKPFVKIEKEKYYELYRRRFGFDTTKD